MAQMAAIESRRASDDNYRHSYCNLEWQYCNSLLQDFCRTSAAVLLHWSCTAGCSTGKVLMAQMAAFECRRERERARQYLSARESVR